MAGDQARAAAPRGRGAVPGIVAWGGRGGGSGRAGGRVPDPAAEGGLFRRRFHGGRGDPHKSTLWAVWGIALVCIWLCRNLINSRHGRNCIAILENELAAQMLGVNTFAYKMKIFALSAAITGLAGGLLGHFTTVLHPSMFGFLKSTEMIITVILGGIQSLTGSILAVILVTVLPEFLRAASEWRMVIYGLAVMLMIILRPQGLLGYRELTMPKILQDLVKKTVDARKASS